MMRTPPRDPLDHYQIDMDVHDLLQRAAAHRRLSDMALALAVQAYLYRSDATAVGAARIVQGLDPDSAE